MIIECPECGAKNQTTQPPQPGKKYRCGQCGASVTFLQTDDTPGQISPSPTILTAYEEKHPSLGYSTTVPIENKGLKKGLATGFFKKARTGVGRLIQIVGLILWLGCGLLMFVWTLYVLFSIFGVWTIFVGLIFAPITYVASIFIIWFSTGIFPLLLLAPYLVSFVGVALLAAGGAIIGDD